ncbi:MAG: NADP-dependent phosphogluconate dehydrogenase [Stomatobaculum sp.]
MKKCDIALYGLGVMGSSLAKNMISHQFNVALYSINEKEREKFQLSGKEQLYTVYESVHESILALKTPRIIFLMISAGAAVDNVLDSLLPELSSGDVIIDGGNSYYYDTERRYKKLKESGILYLGVGVSGGEQGALHGPSMMAGGSRKGWENSRYILEKIAAYVDEKPCCGYIGEGGAGHYVKMIHNGIEYAQLELIAEIYYVMKYGLYLSTPDILSCFEAWKNSEIESYLIDISISVLQKRDVDGEPLVEKILDVAEQKGTGKWMLQDAIEREVYVPTIFEAVSARVISSNKALRIQGAKVFPRREEEIRLDDYPEKLKRLLLFGMIISYAQGIELIHKASEDMGWEIDGEALIGLWKGGCIIRSRLLNQIQEALSEKKSNLILSDTFAYIGALEKDVRECVLKIQSTGLAVPGISSTLEYYDILRMEKMPLNFIQALRDCFGAHTYQRVDKTGRFHTEWENKNKIIEE